MTRFRSMGRYCLIFSLIVPVEPFSLVASTTVVLPPQYANAVTGCDDVAPWGGNLIFADSGGWRFQQLYPTDQIAGILIEMRFREATGGSPPNCPSYVDPVVNRLAHWPRIQIHVAQITRTALSVAYDENLPSTSQLVYDGELTLQSAASTAAPRPFDYRIVLQHPFVITPGAGSLLVDIIGTNPDIQPPGSQRIVVDMATGINGYERLLGGAAASFASAPGGLSPASVNVTEFVLADSGSSNPPTANFTYLPSAPVAGSAVQFTDLSTSSPTAWLWSFGDGQSSFLQNPTHTFGNAGTYPVTLSASNSAGSSTSSQRITVQLPPPVAVTISGHAVVPGEIAIRGDGTFGRQVILLDSNGARTSYVSQLAGDGSYSIAAPPGSYSVYCDVHYTDSYYDVTTNIGSTISVPRRAEYTSAQRHYTSNATADCSFEAPIVFLHGLNSGPSKWNAWITSLRGSTPNVITFTPSYGDLDDYSKEAQTVYNQIEPDFSNLFVATPQYGVVAHSKGGLVARVFKGDFSGFPLVDALSAAVLLGTPNNGSNCFSGAAAAIANLSACNLQSNVNADPRYSRFTIPVFAVAGSQTSATCILDGQPNDGVVPVDSVFKITHVENGTPVSQTLAGTIVPYDHFELGDPPTTWLLYSVIMPFLDSGPAAVGGKACPQSYSTVSAKCGDSRPSPELCIAGHGLTSDGTCNISAPSQNLDSIAITWSAPSAGLTLGPPTAITATISRQASCQPGSMSVNMADNADQPVGYRIYRSQAPIAQLSDGVRIGYADSSETTFVDSQPLVGTNYYAVSAVYSTAESIPSSAPPVRFLGRHRAVGH